MICRYANSSSEADIQKLMLCCKGLNSHHSTSLHVKYAQIAILPFCFHLISPYWVLFIIVENKE